MKKLREIFFLIIIFVFCFLYFKYNEAIKSFFFIQFQRFLPDKINTQKILLVNDEFSLGDYNNLFSIISKSENSVAVILPQLFNIKIGDYVESLTSEEMKKTQEEYKEFIFKLAETPNIILAGFIDNLNTNTKLNIDPCVFKYFKAEDLKLNLKKFNYIKVNNQKIWLTAPDIGFYQNFEYYPYKISILYNFNNCVIINIAIEAIRKYYKLNKKSISYSNNMLKIGTIVNVPVSKSGEIIIYRNNEKIKIYNLNEFLKLSADEINDKIIIIKSKNINENTMVSLSMLIASLMQNIYIYYSSILNYIMGFILFVIFLFFYRLLKIHYGITLMIIIEICIIVSTFLLLNRNIYLDFVLFSLVNFITFFSVYYFKIYNTVVEFNMRAGVIRDYVNEHSLKHILHKNIDIKITNTWFPTFVVYIIFSKEIAENINEIKKDFDKIKDILYNFKKEFFIKLINEKDIAIIFADEIDIKALIRFLFEIRGLITENKYNIVLNRTEVYTYLYGKQLVFVDKNIEIRINAENIEKKRYILVPEKDIQQYINYIKFQKNINVGGILYFNAVGLREEV
ncbi:MAG: hypothetical protein N3E50_02805 [Candidatus Goldbacteria bacterium]|nr:hypothetical protein [Candidatus Goldiibacteriota bacterium]